MELQKIYASIFRVTENAKGDFDVAFDVEIDGQPKTVRFSMVSYDRHAVDTMALMFNRVVSDVSAE